MFVTPIIVIVIIPPFWCTTEYPTPKSVQQRWCLLNSFRSCFLDQRPVRCGSARHADASRSDPNLSDIAWIASHLPDVGIQGSAKYPKARPGRVFQHPKSMDWAVRCTMVHTVLRKVMRGSLINPTIPTVVEACRPLASRKVGPQNPR